MSTDAPTPSDTTPSSEAPVAPTEPSEAVPQAGGGSASGTEPTTTSTATTAAPCVCPGHSRPVVGVFYSPPTPDGVFLISACLDKKPMLRDGDSGDWIGTFEGHKGAVWDSKLNAEATRAATASADYSVKLWDSISGEVLQTWDHPKVVKSVAFSPDGAFLASGSTDGNLRIFDLSDLNKDPVVVPHEGTPVRRLLWSTDGIYTGGEDGKVRLWDATAHTLIKSVELSACVMDMELSRDGSTLTTAAGRDVSFFTAATLEPKASHTLEFEVSTASLHPGGDDVFVAGGKEDLWVHLFDAKTGAQVTLKKGHHGPVHCVRFSPDGSAYSSGSEDGTIRIWPYAAKAADKTK